jgi:hypothetical protein
MSVGFLTTCFEQMVFVITHKITFHGQLHTKAIAFKCIVFRSQAGSAPISSPDKLVEYNLIIYKFGFSVRNY